MASTLTFLAGFGFLSVSSESSVAHFLGLLRSNGKANPAQPPELRFLVTDAPIRAVVFDAVGTLLQPDPPFAAVYAEVGRRFGSKVAGDNLRRAFRAAFSRQEELDCANAWRTSEQRELDRWRAIVGEVLSDAKDVQACFTALYQHFSDPHNWRCDQDAEEVLGALDQRGVKVAMASNFDRRLRPVAAGFPALANLRIVVISSEVGWRKPAPEFFTAVCKSVNEAPGDILFVGDDLANDYEGSLAAGFRPILFDPAGKMPADSSAIRRLGDVLQYLA
jgi:putative hydrolase of the HAD superfamily